MVEQLNVQTPGVSAPEQSSARHELAPATESSDSVDYFGLTAAPESPMATYAADTRAVPSPTVSTTSTASSAATVASYASAAPLTTGKTTPPTPLETDLASNDSLFSLTVEGDGGDDEEEALDQLANALHPVYRNEAWRSIENQRPRRPGPGQRETSSSTLKAYNVASQHSRAEVRRNRERAATHRNHGEKGKSRSTGASALRPPTPEEDLLLESLPAAPGFEDKPKRLGTVEEEECRDERDHDGNDNDANIHQSMDTDNDDHDPSMCASEAESEVAPDSDAYRFLSPGEQRRLLLFLLELVVDSDVLGESGTVTPDLDSPQASPRVERRGPYMPPTLSSASSYYRRGSYDASKRGTVLPSKPAQTCTLGEFEFTATVIHTPSMPETSAPSRGKGGPSGFVILTTPPPRPRTPPHDSVLPQAWPSGTGIGIVARPTAVPLSPDSTPAGSLGQPGETGHVYEAPSAETIRTAPRARRGSRRNSESEGSLDDDQKWLRALGDGEMAQRIRSHDWNQTPLGPISGWCAELRSGVASILASPFRECILWGEDMAIVYNDLYIATAGDKHPALLGLPAREGWKEIWDGLNSVAQKTLAGETCYFKDHFLAMERLGFVEETCARSGFSFTFRSEHFAHAHVASGHADHTFSYAPFRSSNGTVLGILNLSIE